MGFHFYCAMTAAEILRNHSLPPGIAWMACHFSPYDSGLSNLPASLPQESMLIVNDRTPVHNHSPELIVEQLCRALERLQFSCILLDFQRADQPCTAAIAKAIVDTVPCPVGVSVPYAADLPCPVFLPPVPLLVAPEAYLSKWSGREIWLDTAPEAQLATVNRSGTTFSAAPMPDSDGMEDPVLHCRYRISVTPEQIRFHLCRTMPCLRALLHDAASYGVTAAVGLFQEVGNLFQNPEDDFPPNSP